MWKKIVFSPKPEVVFKLDKNGDRNQLNLMQRQYIPKFTTLSYLVRSTDYFQINKENKEKSRKIGINRSKMKILKIWKKIFHISGPRVPHAKNQPPRSKTVAYMQITEWRRKWRRRTHFFAITATWNRFSSMSGPISLWKIGKSRFFKYPK